MGDWHHDVFAKVLLWEIEESVWLDDWQRKDFHEGHLDLFHVRLTTQFEQEDTMRLMKHLRKPSVTTY